MARKKTHVPLNVLINGRPVGQLAKASTGAISFYYAENWLAWEHRFAISLSLPLRPTAYRGDKVAAVFDNLLPDRGAVRRRVAERMGAHGTDAYSLLEAIGRDCVGAMQFLPENVTETPGPYVKGEPVSEVDIEAMLADLAQAPLGVDRDQEFRISIAGAQEKTALLNIDGRWHRPVGTTPTTHILKPQLGQIPSADGMIDMSNSVDNEHYCMRLMAAFGFDVPKTDIVTFGTRRVLVVERFDRRWRGANHILRLPQEDCCQALGFPPTRKYQSDHGPNMRDILLLLNGADNAAADQITFLTSQIIFWLIGATDGHAKNFSIFLHPGGRYRLTPCYDVVSAQPAFDKGQIQPNRFRLAMSAGSNRHYRMNEITGRHFVQTGKAAGISADALRDAIEAVLNLATTAPGRASSEMPKDFAEDIHESIVAALTKRLPHLANALDAL